MNIGSDELLPLTLWRELVWWRAGNRCERCDDKPELLRERHAHHKDHDDQNNRLSNGECLCQKCHYKEHLANYHEHSIETRGKIAASQRGKKFTPEHRANLSAAVTAGLARLTPEARSARAHKAWETKRRRSYL